MATSEISSIDNMEINKKKDTVLISINPKIYSTDCILSAAYIFIDRAYLIIDGDPNEEILVQLKPKDNKENLEKLGREFNNELVNYAFYSSQSLRTMPIRTAIIQRAFQTHDISMPPSEDEELDKAATLLEELTESGGKKIGKSKIGKRTSKVKNK